jgi:glycogen(starch) synthase
MKILIYTPYFYPRIGGVESIARGLADKFTQKGNEVTVVTNTTNNDTDIFPFKVIRNGGMNAYLKAFKACDIYMQMNVSLRGIYPFLFFRKPFSIYHQNTYYRNDGSITMNGRLKYFVSAFADYNVCCSEYVASYIRSNKKVIGNPYDEKIFHSDIAWASRKNDIIFLGRLVSDKGCNTLIETLNLLHLKNMKLKLSIVGDGPEKDNLLALTAKYQLNDFIKFYGSQSGEDLNALLNQHKVMVVPSLWKEPFGIVALEGLAAGCKMVVSKDGGLKEAISKFGITFPNGNVKDMADAIERSLFSIETSGEGEISNHLKQFNLDSVSNKYLSLISTLS